MHKSLPSESEMETLFDRLWPICRSILGPGFRESLDILSEWVPLERLKFKTGEKVFDWTVPKEWIVRDAYIIRPDGKKICDFKKNNLHLLNYSIPFSGSLSLSELKEHLYSLPDQPDAIPYLTSYYKERWGFCISDRELQNLPAGNYQVMIDSKLVDGHLEIGEAVLRGSSDREILFSSYLCHPSLANNELSGPIVLAFLYRLLSQRQLKFTYRFVVSAETIGTISYLTRRGEFLKSKMIAGYQMTCLGDAGKFTYKNTRAGNLFADQVVRRALNAQELRFVDFDPADGSDERQYSSPGFNLPHGSLMRTMYAQYPEYHTSLDNKDFIRFSALRESLEAYLKLVDEIEASEFYLRSEPHGEPLLGPRGLYPTLGGQKGSESLVRNLMWLLNFSDGHHDLRMIADRGGLDLNLLRTTAEKMKTAGLLREV